MSSKVVSLGLNQVGRDMLRPGGRRGKSDKAGEWTKRGGKEGREKSKGRRMFGGDGGKDEKER